MTFGDLSERELGKVEAQVPAAVGSSIYSVNFDGLLAICLVCSEPEQMAGVNFFNRHFFVHAGQYSLTEPFGVLGSSGNPQPGHTHFSAFHKTVDPGMSIGLVGSAHSTATFGGYVQIGEKVYGESVCGFLPKGGLTATFQASKDSPTSTLKCLKRGNIEESIQLGIPISSPSHDDWSNFFSRERTLLLDIEERWENIDRAYEKNLGLIATGMLAATDSTHKTLIRNRDQVGYQLDKARKRVRDLRATCSNKRWEFARVVAPQLLVCDLKENGKSSQGWPKAYVFDTNAVFPDGVIVDSALLDPSESRMGKNTVFPHSYSLSDAGDLKPGMDVMKAGRTTGETTGVVFNRRIWASLGNQVVINGKRRMIVTREYAIVPRRGRQWPFAKAGDQGAWVYSRGEVVAKVTAIMHSCGLESIVFISPMKATLGGIQQAMSSDAACTIANTTAPERGGRGHERKRIREAGV